MVLSFSVALLILIILAFYFIKAALRDRKSAPSPPTWPILGHLPFLGDLPHVSLFKLSNTYGPVMLIKLGQRDTLVVSSPAVAKEVLHVHDKIFSSRPLPAMPKLLRADTGLVWSPYGEHWKFLRRIATTELFSARSLDSMTVLRKEEVKQMIVSIFEDSKTREPMKISSKAFATTIGIIEQVVCGRKVSTGDVSELKDMVWRVLQLAGKPSISDIFPIMETLDLSFFKKEEKKVAKRFIAFFDTILEDHTREMAKGFAQEGRKDFLYVLMDMQKNNPEFKKEYINALLADMFIAGTDTSSSTVEWALTELLRRPEAMKKAQAELDTLIGHERLMDESDIQNLPYLQAVTKEVLRLHPATPLFVPRKADEDCEIQGYRVLKGTQVMVNTWGIARDENVWERPLSFEPERFETNNIDYKGQDFKYLPFGCGRRICIGMPLAAKTVQFMVGSMIHCFDWNAVGGVDLDETFGITLQKANPLVAYATPRLSPKLYT